MIQYKVCTTDEELYGILALQQSNLFSNLPQSEKDSQGFVTVLHSYTDLKRLQDIEPHLVTKDGNNVIAYLLAMTEKSRQDIRVLIPMFEMFERITYKGKYINGYQYIVVGHACVDKAYRGQGILDEAYTAYRHQFADRYEFAITEIAQSNLRSLKAHQRIGFIVVHSYTNTDGTKWNIVLWDWRQAL